MVKSMTGYGRAREMRNKRDITVEVRSVNNRYLDCTVKMPRMYSFAEDAVKQCVQRAISRGKVDVFITVDASAADVAKVTVNRELAALYARRKSACCSASRKAGAGWSAIQSGMGGSAGAGASVEAGVTSAGGVGVSAVGAAQAPRTSARPAANSTSGRFTVLTPPRDMRQWPGGAYR